MTKVQIPRKSTIFCKIVVEKNKNKHFSLMADFKRKLSHNSWLGLSKRNVLLLMSVAWFRPYWKLNHWSADKTYLTSLAPLFTLSASGCTCSLIITLDTSMLIMLRLRLIITNINILQKDNHGQCGKPWSVWVIIHLGSLVGKLA